ncbi:hypothetical protein [Sphingomonas crusticola]|uniref:hypothetical protein n=1 Tax=Sphingomonas crusticola TaxID=1697973 RepID=UPI000E259C98|nr:hypothetical protein [Sphingomonas crusticola]
MKISAIIAAAMLSAVAVPAFAAAGGETAKLKATYDAKRDKYCVSQQITGQRIPVRDCRTKAEWAQEGAFFADAKKAQDTTLAQK